jgi:hypothetical protein
MWPWNYWKVAVPLWVVGAVALAWRAWSSGDRVSIAVGWIWGRWGVVVAGRWVLNALRPRTA